MINTKLRRPTGELRLDVSNKNGVSIPENIYFQGAFKLMRPQYLDNTGQLMYCLLNPGGGYLDGDRYQINLDIETDADLYFTMQSATKIYKTPRDIAKQNIVINIAKNGILEYSSDPIIPFQNSSYVQNQVINITDSSSLFTSEIVTPGWSEDQQGFQYDYLKLGMVINYNDSLLVTDNFVLEPKQYEVEELGLLNGYSHYASIYIINPEIDTQFIEKLENHLIKDFPNVLIGITSLSIPGLAIRMLGNSTYELQDVIDECQYSFRRILLNRSNQLFKKY